MSMPPIGIEAVVTVNLLRLGAAMNLHGRLLVAVVAGYVESAGGHPRHLCDRGPRVPSAGDVLQQRLIKSGRSLDVLQVNYVFSFNANDVRHFSNLEFGVDGRRKTRRKNYACLGEALESFRGNADFISPGRQQV